MELGRPAYVPVTDLDIGFEKMLKITLITDLGHSS
jgi:hypothetical protein